MMASTAERPANADSSLNPRVILTTTTTAPSRTTTSATIQTPNKKASHMSTVEAYRSNSMPFSVGIYWVFPMFCIAILSRFAVDTGPAFLPPSSKPLQVSMNVNTPQQQQQQQQARPPQAVPVPASNPPNTKPTMGIRSKEDASKGWHSSLINKPESYQEAVKAIRRRRLDFATTSIEPMGQYKQYPPYAKETTTSSGSTDRTDRVVQESSAAPTKVHETSSSTTTHEAAPSKSATTNQRQTSRGAATDPARQQALRQVESFQRNFETDPSNLLNTIKLADAMRIYDVQYHDGGSMQQRAIEVYQIAITLAEEERERKVLVGEETNRALTGLVDVNEEITMDYSARSIDGILCSLYSSLGKVYFMANMFEKAVESYSKAIAIEPTYLDAVSARGSSLIILGKYADAAADFMFVIERDTKRRFLDVFTGLARVLQAREEASPEGWGPMIDTLQNLVPILESQVDHISQPEGRAMVSSSLARLHHVLFLYHDSKTKDIDSAWDSLTKAYEFKMSSLPPWRSGFEAQKIQSTKQIFHKGFWPDAGSQSRAPIFIIGFVRSGSTLLERILDAHPQIVGTGENSVFNGQLDNIRNQIVKISMLGDTQALNKEVERLADGVVKEMQDRWDMVASAEDRAADRSKPSRFVDKMLTNYYNVGFIHMLFPNALILHVAREPMDTIFSAYKHEFPAGPLDYTSAFDSLAEMYRGYRDVIEHWDEVLPGRILHVNYEDMVRDTPGVTRAIINATGLEWHDEILDFHKKKQAVNTLSTTQVRKGIYTDSLQAWRKYETQLQPLLEKIGDRVHYGLKTTVPGYQKPVTTIPSEDETKPSDEL